LLGHLVSQIRAQELPLLSEHPVPVEVSVGAVIPAYVECVVAVLEGPAWLLPAVLPLVYVILYHGRLLPGCHTVDDIKYLLHRPKHVRIERCRDDLPFRVLIVIDERDRFAPARPLVLLGVG